MLCGSLGVCWSNGALLSRLKLLDCRVTGGEGNTYKGLAGSV